MNRIPAILLLAATAGCAGIFAEESPAPEPLVRWDARTSLSDSEGSGLRAARFGLGCASPAILGRVSFGSLDQIADLSEPELGSRGGRGPMGIARNDVSGPL